MIAHGYRDGGLFYYQVALQNNEDLTTSSCSSVQTSTDILLPNKTAVGVSNGLFSKVGIDVIHARLGHVSLSKMKHIPIYNCSGLTEFNCDICSCVKFHKLPFDKSLNRAVDCFDLVHMDLWGPYRVAALDGTNYFFTILDDHSRVTWTYLLKNKMKVYRIVTSFLSMVETQFSKKIKCIRTDNGTKIVQDQCLKLFDEHRIIHQRSVPGVPQQNGKVERKLKHLLEVSRAMRLHVGLPKKI